jgi:2-polyprenyl-3-methyl-5-hydroxy-6-metoxy-1,4-benzoquinol methylase
MVSHNKCPLCSSDETEHFLNCTDTLVSGREFELRRCKSCNFIFTNNYPDEKEIARYYDSDNYISHSDSARTITDQIYQIVRRFMLRRKREIITRESRITKGNILDIGCGTGHFLNEMKGAGWGTTGIEVNEKARDYAISKFSLDVISPEQISSLPANKFECITLWHVLEHFHDPFAYFTEIKRLLKPGGIIVVALPNSSSFDATYYGNKWAAFDVPRHLWHFDPVTFSRFASKAGFTVTDLRVLPFDVFYISMLSEKQKGSVCPSLVGLIKGKIWFLLSLFKKKRGSSVVYVIKAA